LKYHVFIWEEPFQYKDNTNMGLFFKNVRVTISMKWESTPRQDTSTFKDDFNDHIAYPHDLSSYIMHSI